jgi:DNA replication protein DnaC
MSVADPVSYETGKPLNDYLLELRLPAIRRSFGDKARRAEAETLSYQRYLLELVELECQERRENRIARLLQESKLPLEKTWENFDLKRLPQKAARQVKTLQDGTFLDRKENVLTFGNPGSGKTHLLSALGQELIRAGRRVAFTTCVRLVQDLLLAKKELRLNRAIRKLAYYEALVIDDLGYVLAADLNKAKILQAPVTVIIGHDLDFAAELPKLMPHAAERMQQYFATPGIAEVTAMRNGTLQGAYLIIAARALGLDCGPMSGFDNAGVDKAFFSARESS